jgi:hypothetical protein
MRWIALPVTLCSTAPLELCAALTDGDMDEVSVTACALHAARAKGRRSS